MMSAVNEQIEDEEVDADSTKQKVLNKNLENGKTTKINKEKLQLQRNNCPEGILYRLVNEERKSVLRTLTHSTIPGFNLSVSKTNLKNLSNFPLFHCSIPNSVYVSSEQSNKVDLCHKRTMEHYDYMYLLSRQRAFYEIAEKKKDFKKSMKKKIYPYTIINYAELLENNPDPYFQSRYDWYYTGGNLKSFSDNNLICHSTGSNLNELVLSRLKKKSRTHHLKSFSTLDFSTLRVPTNSEIFEIQSLSLKNRFSVRQKYSLSFLTYDENDLICDYVLSNEETPFITSAGDFFSELIATGNLNKEVFLWDFKNSTKIPKQKLFPKNINSKDKSKNWNSLCYINNNIFAFTTLNEFCLLDIRQSENESISNLCKFDKYTEICENISSLAKSNYDNLIYFGTTHKLFNIDTRFISKEITDKYIVQRWTHQMESAPLILKTYKWKENYELIALSSLLSGDIRICENFCKLKNNKSKYISTCLPFMPPSLQDGYKIAKINGECLDPITNLEKRINSCTTGLDFVEKGENLYLMNSNSLGDIFSTQLNFDEDIKYSDNYNKEIMINYNAKVKLKLKRNPLSLNLTDLVQLQAMSKVFRCKRLNNGKSGNNNTIDPIYSIDNDEPPQHPKRKEKWQKSLSELYAYKDVLASNLLAVWDMELPEDSYNLPIIDKKSKKDNVAKVDEWLNDESQFLNDSMQSDTANFAAAEHSTLMSHTRNKFSKEDNLNDSYIFDNSLKESSQKINTIVHMDIDNSFELTKQSIKNNSFSEKAPGQILDLKITKREITEKRKRNYVKGF